MCPLALPAPEQSDRLEEVPSVAVFIDQARRACPDILFDPADLATVVAIVARLDGIPLALELAAGRLVSMTLDDLAARPDRALDRLARGRAPDDRHATLRAAVDWSYLLLPENEQRLFRNLAVFPDGFDLATAEAARPSSGPGGPPHAAGHLVNASMLLAVQGDVPAVACCTCCACSGSIGCAPPVRSAAAVLPPRRRRCGRVVATSTGRSCTIAIADVEMFRGRGATARELALRAADQSPLGAFAYGLAVLSAAYDGDVDVARALHARAERAGGFPTMRGFTEYVAGEINNVAGEWAAAEARYARALELARHTGATFLDAIASVGLVSAYAAGGRFAEALTGYGT